MASMLWAPPLVVGQPGPLHLGPQTQRTLEVLDSSWEMGLEAAPPLWELRRERPGLFCLVFSLMCGLEKMTLIKQTSKS